VSQTKIYVNDTLSLDVGIRNPVNESLSVTVRVFVENVDCFPSNESSALLPPKDLSTPIEEIEFMLTPRQSGTHPLEVQLWWNETKVDYKLFTLEVQEPAPLTPPIEPDIWWSWVRLNLIIWGLPYMVIAVRFANPSLEIVVDEENAKLMTFLMISVVYCFLAFVVTGSLGNYDTIHWVVSSIGEIQIILAIAWGLVIISLGSCLLKKFDWSNRFSNFVFLFVLLSLAWDWLLFPQWPFPQWSPILVIVLGALLQVLLEMGIKGVFKRLKSLGGKKGKR